MSDARQGRRLLFGVLFLLSGAAGLVYEQLWIRELQHFFGSTIHSITTVRSRPSRTTFAFPKGIMKFDPGFGALLYVWR